MQETSGNQSADAVETPAANPRPLPVYDGDCGFCTYWARYWQKLTGDRVQYRPYQEVTSQYPAISQADFQRAVQFIAPDGQHAAAAEASFLTLSHTRGRGFWLALYRSLPGFATISELAYAFIAARRPAFFRVSLLLWGRNHEPPRYDLVSFLFLRLFALIYLSAFVSFAVQAQGLIGSLGSRVIRGNLLVVPIGASILYVSPLYLRAQSGQLPELKRVIAAYGERVVMEETLPAALAALFKQSASVAGLPAVAGSSPSGPADERARQALADYDRAIDRLKAGDWAGFGAELDALRPLLEGLSRPTTAH